MSFEENLQGLTKVFPSLERNPESQILTLMNELDKLTVPCVEAFSSWLNEILKILKSLKRKNNSLEGVNKKFNERLLVIHTDGIEILRNIIKRCINKELVEITIKSLLNLLPIQARALMPRKNSFPVEFYTEILYNIINAEGPANMFMEPLKEVLGFLDMASYFWKCLEMALLKTNMNDSVVHKTLLLVGLTPKTGIIKKKDEDKEENKFFCRFEGVTLAKKQIALSILKIWEILLSTETSGNTKQLLVLTVIERMMDRMDKPLFLTDYFMSCLEYGGAVSVLGLQGIFVLIQKHNITYPDVYSKLYSLFIPNLFSTPYKSRLYFLSDIFLSSTHLPEAMVAGFIKRLARLSLIAPPTDIIIIMKFITNLIIRHPGLKKIIHNSADYTSDPYNCDEVEPGRSGAINSSLWEVRLLQNHVIPSVAASAMFISNPLPSVEHNIADDLDLTTSDIFSRESKKTLKEVPVCFERPSSSLLPNSETGFIWWTFSN